MITRRQKIRLGIFILVSFLILITLVISVAGPNLLQQWNTYEIHFSDSSVRGVSEGTTVYYSGISVGSVHELRFDPDDMRTVIAEISIDADVPIREDTKAELVTAGITGSTDIELSGGSPDAKPLDPGSRIPAEMGSLQKLLDPATNIGERVNSMTAEAELLFDVDNPASFTRLLLNLNQVIENNNQNFEDSLSSLAQATNQLNSTLTKLDSLITHLDAELEQAQLGVAGRQLRKASDDVGETAQHIDSIISKSEGDLLAGIRGLRVTSENLSQFSFLLSEDPGLILRSRGD